MRQKRNEQLLLEKSKDDKVKELNENLNIAMRQIKRDYVKDTTFREEAIWEVESKFRKAVASVEEEYKSKLKKVRRNNLNLEEGQARCLFLINALETEISGLKKKVDKLKNEQANYYLDILKIGIDSRREGLTWVVKRLVELNFPLSYKIFPVFLNKEQADYIIKVT